MDIEEYIKNAEMRGYQPYWACYCYCMDIPIDDAKNYEFMIWIQERHREFDPDVTSHRGTPEYAAEFLEFLKGYVNKKKEGK